MAAQPEIAPSLRQDTATATKAARTSPNSVEAANPALPVAVTD